MLYMVIERTKMRSISINAEHRYRTHQMRSVSIYVLLIIIIERTRCVLGTEMRSISIDVQQGACSVFATIYDIRHHFHLQQTDNAYHRVINSIVRITST